MKPYTLPSGAALQTSLRGKTIAPPSSMGLLLRGVVVATYVTDDAKNAYNTVKTTPYAVFCDVLCYGPGAGGTQTLITNALVSQDRAGIQSGDVWHPRAASIDTSGQPLSLAYSNLMALDGDHVLIGFIDGTYQSPVILRCLPHPQADTGQSAAEPADGQRVRLKLTDGSPDLRKTLGVVTGVDKSANVVMRTLYANDGSLTAKGAPPAPPATSDVGNIVMQMHKRAQRLTQLLDMDSPAAPVEVLREVVQASLVQLQFLTESAHFVVQDSGGNTLEAKGSGHTATLQVGEGLKHVALGEYLLALYDQLAIQFNTHVHGTSLGPSISAAASGFTAPAWDSRIVSTKVSVPDEP